MTGWGGCWRGCSLCDTHVMTHPPSPAGSGTPRWTPGSRRREHSCISSGSQDRTCPSAHVNRCQGGEESSGVSDSQTHTQGKQHLLPPGAAETRLLGKFPCRGTIMARLYTPSGPRPEWTIRARRQGDKKNLPFTSARVGCYTLISVG